jgi:hypothetical protein
MHTVYFLHVSATHVAIFREVHYKDRYIEIPVLQTFLNQCTYIKYYILNIIHGLKYILKIKIRIKIFVIGSNSTYICIHSVVCRTGTINTPLLGW